MLRVALIRMVYMGIMFFAGLVLSNLALPEKFGTISLLILNASLLSLITGFGSDSMVLYKVSNKQWNISKAFQFTWRAISIQLSIFTLLEFGSLILFHKTILSAESSGYFFIDLAYFTGLIIVEKYMALFYSLHRSKAINKLLLLTAVVYLLFLLLFYYFIKVDFVYVLYIFALQSLAQAIAAIIFLGFNHSAGTNLENKEFLNAVRLSSIVMVTNVIQLFAYRVDFWMLKYFYNSYEVGLYAQANKFANLSWIIPNILAQLLLPKFATMDKSRIKEIFNTAFYFNFLVGLGTIVCTLFFYLLYLKPEYKAGLSAFFWMLPGYFLWASVIYFGAYISSAGKFFYNLVGSSICFVLIFIADIILIPPYGMKGAAIANTITYFCVFILYLFIITKKFSIHLSDLLVPGKKIFSNILKFSTSE